MKRVRGTLYTGAILAICLLFFLSCANQYKGKILPADNYPDVSCSGSHHVEYNLIRMDYDCVVDKDAGSLTLSGTIQIPKDGYWDRWEISELMFIVYFLNSSRKVIAVDYIAIEPSEIVADKIKFKKLFAYDPQYKYVTYSYECWAKI